MKIENILKNEPKTSLIMSVTGMTLYNTTLAQSQDAKSIRNILIDKYGRKRVDILGKSTVKDDLVLEEPFTTYQQMNVDDYDEVIIITGADNAFGGHYKCHILDLWRDLSESNCKFYFYFNDVKFPPVNFAHSFEWRQAKNKLYQESAQFVPFTFTEDQYKKLNDIFGNAPVLSSWIDYNAIIDNYKNKKNVLVDNDWTFFDFDFSKTTAKYTSDNSYKKFSDRQYDFMFYSVDTKFKSRLSIIEKYIKDEDKKCYVGLSPKTQQLFESTPNLVCYKNMMISDIQEKIMRDTRYTLIFSDDLCNDNCKTWRFYECMYANILAFIIDDYDPKHRYIKNKELADFIYVKTPEEYFDRISQCNADEELYKHIIDLEIKEVMS